MQIFSLMRLVFLVVLTAWCGIALAAGAPNNPGTTPTVVDNHCAAHLTRSADETITMGPNKQDYLVESSAAPGNSYGQFDVAHIPCKRRVIEVKVPHGTTSGCANCYPNAEIHACTGDFSNSKVFEEHCHVPKSSISEAVCKTYNHRVEVYKKAAGQSKFADKPLKTFVYRGFMDNGQCRVAAKYLGQIHDTSEVYPNVTPPASGTDVYRILSYPVYNGAILPTVVVVEFEPM